MGRHLTPMTLTSSLHHFVDLALNVELRMFGFDTFKLDGNFFSCSNVRTLAKKENYRHYLASTTYPKLAAERTLLYILYIWDRNGAGDGIQQPCTWLGQNLATEPHTLWPSSYYHSEFPDMDQMIDALLFLERDCTNTESYLYSRKKKKGGDLSDILPVLTAHTSQPPELQAPIFHPLRHTKTE